MNLAMIFAMLLQSGVCAQSEFHDASGRTLMVMVCPRMAEPGAANPGGPPADEPPAAPEAPDAPPAPEAPQPPAPNT
jgi:hypothetical protein